MQKTTKSKVANKPEKAPMTSVAATGKEVSAGKFKPTEDQIREKAKEIYHQRIMRGEMGSAIDDWNKAEKLLKNQGR